MRNTNVLVIRFRCENHILIIGIQDDMQVEFLAFEEEYAQDFDTEKFLNDHESESFLPPFESLVEKYISSQTKDKVYRYQLTIERKGKYKKCYSCDVCDFEKIS